MKVARMKLETSASSKEAQIKWGLGKKELGTLDRSGLRVTNKVFRVVAEFQRTHQAISVGRWKTVDVIHSSRETKKSDVPLRPLGKEKDYCGGGEVEVKKNNRGKERSFLSRGKGKGGPLVLGRDLIAEKDHRKKRRTRTACRWDERRKNLRVDR